MSATTRASCETRRRFLKTLGVGTAALSAPKWLRAAEQPKRKLNFVFFLVDDLGWRDLGCFGSTFYDTPNVDKLCAQGMQFTNAYAACPVCSPTRASIMTGKYPVRLPLTDFLKGNRKEKLLPADYLNEMPLAEVTLAEALKESGYTTFFAGKWHLGGEGFWPENQGFDVNKGGWSAGGPYGHGKYFTPYGNPRLEDGPKGEHLPDRLATETVKFIESSKDKPFLAYLSFYSVHTPLMARPDLKAKYEEKAKTVKHDGPDFAPEHTRQVRLVQDHAVYGGMVEAMDQAVGKVVAGLQQAGIADHTAIFFMSDNGGLSTSEGSPTSNLPLRAGKGWLYEGGIREPMFVVWPGVAKPGAVCDAPVVSTDFYPTMLDMAGLPAKPQQHLDGVSFVPLLRAAGSLPARPLFWHYPHYGNQGGAPGGAVRLGDWKLIEWFEDDHVELYNLKDDLGEKNDLAARLPEKADELRKLLRDWRKSVNANMPKPNPDYDPDKDPSSFAKGAKDGDFATLLSAAVDASDLGYALRTAPNQTGFAVKRLSEAYPGPFTLEAKLQTLVKEDDSSRFRNGFLVFGDSADPAKIVKCGLYLGGRRFCVIEDAGTGNVAPVQVPLKADANQVFSLEVTADPDEGLVILRAGDLELKTTLSRKFGPVSYAGYCASHTVTAFSEIEPVAG
jgi:arylsulfatase A-like enzyme